MSVFGKSLSEYIKFQKIFLIITVAVGLIRLGMSMAGVPNSIATYFSMTAVSLVGIVYYAISVHTKGFGSYKQVFILLAIQSTLANVIVSLGITITALTGVINIFSAPEFSGGANPWIHAGTHLVLGPTIIALVYWIISVPLMFITKKVSA